jgi:hypothetical protein
MAVLSVILSILYIFLLSLELAPPFPQKHFRATNREERLRGSTGMSSLSVF